jgi:hypothetical protein
MAGRKANEKEMDRGRARDEGWPSDGLRQSRLTDGWATGANRAAWGDEDNFQAGPDRMRVTGRDLSYRAQTQPQSQSQSQPRATAQAQRDAPPHGHG